MFRGSGRSSSLRSLKRPQEWTGIESGSQFGQTRTILSVAEEDAVSGSMTLSPQAVPQKYLSALAHAVLLSAVA